MNSPKNLSTKEIQSNLNGFVSLRLKVFADEEMNAKRDFCQTTQVSAPVTLMSFYVDESAEKERIQAFILNVYSITNRDALKTSAMN